MTRSQLERVLRVIEAPAVPARLGDLSADELKNLDDGLAAAFVAIQGRLATLNARRRTERVPDVERLVAWKRDATRRMAVIQKDRAAVRIELRRHGSGGRAGVDARLVYPRLRELADALADWDGCPPRVTAAARLLARALEAENAPEDDRMPTWLPGAESRR